ncbi:alpha/beta fold hydrolase [Actinomycetospora chibensis]|uniref:Alpha/beta fold hydrolase n=1 Tax=Actinomycetospora chibensis TaxID=663606 RepID=A0ABV9RIB7_9PSEU|nr:alpha/beta fold hydrolase [Actinomycetospora chibensis]MDD7927288.1 alpha/beta fold hydrolase [Actinomycetospora chibensis]
MTTMTTTAAADLFRRPPDRFLDVGAGQAAYRRVGAGPDVLFVHGWPVSSATFRTLLPHLVDHVTCHLVDLPGAGSSRFDAGTHLSVEQHIRTVRALLGLLDLEDVAVVGHDSGGLIARHALVGDPRLRAMALLDTEQPAGLGLRFRSFLTARHLPGFGAGLGWALSRPRVRRLPFVLGGAFADPSLLEGEFDEFFLRPLHQDAARRDAAVRLLRSFDPQHVRDLADVHGRLDVPVQLIWGAQDAFFPLRWAEQMVATFPRARLDVVPEAGLFVHEERPHEVAAALLRAVTT